MAACNDHQCMRQLTSLDAQYLAMENGRTQGHVSILGVFDAETGSGRPLDAALVRELVTARMHLLPTFRWRLASVPFGLDHPYWVDDGTFDVEYHVQDAALPAPGTQRQLADLVAHLIGRQLDRARPLWELYVIQGLEDGSAAVLTKMHHSAVDGVSGAEVAADYTGPPRDPDNFAATFVVSSAYMSRSWSKRELGEAVASRVWMDRSPSWGRVYLAALMSWPTRHPDDAGHLPDLIRTGWRLGGYHLQLELLDTSRYVHDLLGDEGRERMIEVLNEIDTQHNINLSTLHLEALARYGQIEALTTREDIQAAIAEVLSDVDDPIRQTAAQVIVGRIFDDEGVVGPYSEAIYSLPVEQRLDLYAMSVLAADFSMAYQIASRSSPTMPSRHLR